LPGFPSRPLRPLGEQRAAFFVALICLQAGQRAAAESWVLNGIMESGQLVAGNQGTRL